MLFTRQWYDKLIICGLVLGLFLYVSYRPQFRLREQMPPEFGPDTTLDSRARSAELRIAQRYWTCAVQQIQWRYAYGSQLPQDPPSDYTITAAGVKPSASELDTRIHYWKKLHLVWTLPDAWEKTYTWTLDWIGDGMEAVSNWLQEHVAKPFNAFWRN
jgi:hypothetical protein